MADNTYTTLGKEIHLTHKGYGKYDIHLQAEDFVMRTDLQALDSAIRVKLLTAYREMYNIPHYQYWGNHTHEYLKDLKSQLNLVKIREATMKALLQMRRVKSVELVEVTPDKENTNQVNVVYNVTSISDEVVTGGIII